MIFLLLLTSFQQDIYLKAFSFQNIDENLTSVKEVLFAISFSPHISFLFSDLKNINVDYIQLCGATVVKGPGKRFKERLRPENVGSFEF